MSAATVFVAGGFFQFRAATIRFLQAASRWGSVHVLLMADEPAPADDFVAFTLAEREYILANNRFVSAVTIAEGPRPWSGLPLERGRPVMVLAPENGEPEALRAFCRERGIEYRVLPARDLEGFPVLPSPAVPARKKKVVVTGCFDWLHSGHVRFFEEASAFGSLFVVVGSDANLRLLKGSGHPLFPQEERRYVVQSVRFVAEALVSTGSGWMDAEPEIEKLRPDIYLVNDDGDQPEKRDFCRRHGMEYVVLKRAPKPGLPPRRSTDLRGY